QPEPDAEPRRRRPQEIARGEEPALVEQPVRRQEQLPVDVPDSTVLEERSGDEQPMVAGLLDERHDRRQVLRLGGERGETGIVEADRDLGREVLEQVTRETELGEDDEARATLASLADQGLVTPEVLVESAEDWRDLGERDAECRHGRSLAG